MFAILETGGKQYRVEPGDIIEVERIDQSKITKQNKVNFDSVLLIKDQDVHIGQPYVANGRVEAKILEELKNKKIIVFKKKAKKGYKKTRGHRQIIHRIEIEKIELGSAPPVEKEVQAGKEAKATETVKKPAPKKTVKKVEPKVTESPKEVKETAAEVSDKEKTKVAKKPAVSKTAAKKPTADKPAAKKATADKPAAKKTTARKTTAAKAAVKGKDQPEKEKPADKKPAKKSPPKKSVKKEEKS